MALQKRTGEYFLYGEGNPGSKWAEKVPYDNAYIAGADIQPLTFEQAQDWFEKANNADPELATDEVYDQEFGTLSNPNEAKAEKVQVKLYLNKLAKRKLERLAQKQGKTQSDIVESLIMSE
ncbi:hypothetical protein HMPREF9209_0366 [Lactobacillus gasseri 224-1]|uniref:Uncharacterized protein n=1 Tax=Lactobacillus gasseri 224-1 TaxID=679196 RepID=D1YH13_LACGS|nr:hypothetical protein HMPREF9209_0366 [Lactobacillus gasseri 224-1]